MPCLHRAGAETALAVPDRSLAVRASKWGIDLHRLTPSGARTVAQYLAVPPTPVSRPHSYIDLAKRCIAHYCDAAFAKLRFGGRYHLPAGTWHFRRPFTLPSGVTFFGDGPQKGTAGGTELRYVGSLAAGDAAVRFGPGGGDMGGARLFGVRIATSEHLRGGFALRARDATNASTIESVSAAGFPDGQILIDRTPPPTAGSGPNFFRIIRFSLTGGVHPLRVETGRQTLLIEHGTIALGRASRDGIYLTDGEQLAATRVVQSVTVTGDRRAPGFRIRGPAVTAFILASRSATTKKRLRSPAFLYTASVPRSVTECLRCSVSGTRPAFRLEGLAEVAAARGVAFDYLNPNSRWHKSTVPFNLEPPTISGMPKVGGLCCRSTAAGRMVRPDSRMSGCAASRLQCRRIPLRAACPSTGLRVLITRSVTQTPVSSCPSWCRRRMERAPTPPQACPYWSRRDPGRGAVVGRIASVNDPVRERPGQRQAGQDAQHDAERRLLPPIEHEAEYQEQREARGGGDAFRRGFAPQSDEEPEDEGCVGEHSEDTEVAEHSKSARRAVVELCPPRETSNAAASASAGIVAGLRPRLANGEPDVRPLRSSGMQHGSRSRPAQVRDE